jgi:hypothetical protein
MNGSSLALRIEEFESANARREELREVPRMSIVESHRFERRARRLTLTTRRIQLRDPGLRQFRVF